MPSTDSSKAAKRHSWYGLFSLRRTASHLMDSVEHSSEQNHSHHRSRHSHILHSHSKRKEGKFYVLRTGSHRDLKMVVPAERKVETSNSPPPSRGLRVLPSEERNVSDPLAAREFARRKLESQQIQNMNAARLINSGNSGSPERAKYRPFSMADANIDGREFENSQYSHLHSESIQSDISTWTLDPKKARASNLDETSVGTGSRTLERRGTRSQTLEFRRKPPPGVKNAALGKSERNVVKSGSEAVKQDNNRRRAHDKEARKNVSQSEKRKMIGTANQRSSVEKDIEAGLKSREKRAEMKDGGNTKQDKAGNSVRTSKPADVNARNATSKEAGGRLQPVEELSDRIQREIDHLKRLSMGDGMHFVEIIKDEQRGTDNASEEGVLGDKSTLSESNKDVDQSTTSSSVPDFLEGVDGMSSLDKNLTDDFDEQFGNDVADASLKPASRRVFNGKNELELPSVKEPLHVLEPTNPGLEYTGRNVNRKSRTASIESTLVVNDNSPQLKTPVVSRLGTECTYSDSASDEEFSDEDDREFESNRRSLQRLSMNHRMIADLQNELPQEVLGSSSGSKKSRPVVGDSSVSKKFTNIHRSSVEGKRPVESERSVGHHRPIRNDSVKRNFPTENIPMENNASHGILPIVSDGTDEDQFTDAEEALMKTPPQEKNQGFFPRSRNSILSGKRVQLNDEDSFHSAFSSANNTPQMKLESEKTSPMAWKRLQVDVPKSAAQNSQIKLIATGGGPDVNNTSSRTSLGEHPYSASCLATPNSSASVVSTSTHNLILPTPIEERSRSLQVVDSEASGGQSILSPPRSLAGFSPHLSNSYGDMGNGSGIHNGKDNDDDDESDSGDELSFIAKQQYNHHLDLQHREQPRKMVIVNPSEGSTISSQSRSSEGDDFADDNVPSIVIPLPTEAMSRGSFESVSEGSSSGSVDIARMKTSISDGEVTRTNSEATNTDEEVYAKNSCSSCASETVFARDQEITPTYEKPPSSVGNRMEGEETGKSLLAPYDITGIPKTYDRREKPVVEPLAHSVASVSRKRQPLDIPNEGRGRRSISISTANPGLFDNTHTKERIRYANGSGGSATPQQVALNSSQQSNNGSVAQGKHLRFSKSIPEEPEGKGQKSLYVERLRGIGMVSCIRQQPPYEVLPVAIRPIRSKHRKTPSHEATVASIQSSLKHGTLRPKTRMLASEIDESELPDSKLSHDLSKTKVPTDPDAEIIEVTNQLMRLTADPVRLSRRESNLNRFSSVRSARGLAMNGKSLKLFVANPDQNV